MKKWITIVCCLLGITSIAQVEIGEQFMDTYRELYNEQVYVHQNTSLALAGEKLLFSVYVLQPNLSPSGLSQVAYLKLIHNNEAVFSQKIKLKDGVGTGDFTVPSSLATGNYKLIAYTQWMRNFGSDGFFQSDVHIINPYTLNPQAISATDAQAPRLQDTKRETVPNQQNLIGLWIEKDSYAPREKVNLSLKPAHNPNSYGNYSISVRAINPKSLSESEAATLLATSIPQVKQAAFKDNKVYPPEINGELITGTVIDKQTNLPSPKLDLTFSMAKHPNLFKVTATNSLGVFYFDLPQAYQKDRALIEVLDHSGKEFEVKVAPAVKMNTNNIRYTPLQLATTDLAWLRKRSIDNQIENAYFGAKFDRPIVVEDDPLFYAIDFNYELDEYKRFPSVQETLVEVVEHVFTSNENGKRVISIRDYQTKRDDELAPLILIDGVFITDHDDFLNFNVASIKSIGVIVDKFVYGAHYFQGVLIVSTFDGNYQGKEKPTNQAILEMEPVAQVKSFFQPAYDLSDERKRIPDYRTQLFWEPIIKLTGPQADFSFFTSDNEGWYEVSIQGFTFSGEPVSITERFEVRKKKEN